MQGGLEDRADNSAISIRFEFFFSFRLLGLQGGKFPPRLDDLKLRLGAEFGKLGKARFSTGRGFRCGRGWISQPFVA
jgi:hypothetical protein